METGPNLIGATLGQYQNEALVGHGGMGYVYRARDTALGRSGRGIQTAHGIAVLPLAGGEPAWIPSDGSAATGTSGIFQWAADGKGVYFTTAERTNLFFYRLGTPAQTNVTHLTPDAVIFNGAISRDGRTMLVTRGAQGRDAFLITGFR